MINYHVVFPCRGKAGTFVLIKLEFDAPQDLLGSVECDRIEFQKKRGKDEYISTLSEAFKYGSEGDLLDQNPGIDLYRGGSYKNGGFEGLLQVLRRAR